MVETQGGGINVKRNISTESLAFGETRRVIQVLHTLSGSSVVH